LSKTLLMKIGNTSTAWECGSQRAHFPTEDWREQFSKLAKKFPNKEWWIASVLLSEKNKMKSALRGVEARWIELAKIPGTFAYKKNLGIDRALNIHAVRSRNDFPAIIVDCGTAITVEFLDARGRHQGGWVFPGLKLQLGALHNRTDALPLLRFNKPRLKWGRSTAECINAGVYETVAAAIQSARQKAEEQCGKKVNIILTGGWARAFLRPGTKYRGRLVFEALSDLAKQKVKDERSRSTLRRARY